MICPECKKKIPSKAKHCPECGIEITNSPKEPIISKKILLTLLIIVILFLLLIIIYLKEKYNEKNIAINYFEAIITQNPNKGFKYLNVEQNELINTKTFKKVIEMDKNLTKVINYTIQDINYSKDKEEAIVTISYITKNNKKHQTKDIVLTNTGKKYILFNNWKIKTNEMISNNYKIYIPKEYDIKLDGIKIKDKYIKSNNKKAIVYQIDKIFIGPYNVEVKYKDMDLETKIYVQKKNANSYINNLYLPKETSTKLEKELVNELELIYKNCIKSNAYKDFKKDLKTAKDNKIEDIYEELLDTTNYYYAQLKDFDVEEYNLINTKIDNKVHITIAVKYKYKRKYYGNVEKKNKTDNIEFIVKKEDGKYKLYDIKKLTYYFN